MRRTYPVTFYCFALVTPTSPAIRGFMFCRRRALLLPLFRQPFRRAHALQPHRQRALFPLFSRGHAQRPQTVSWTSRVAAMRLAVAATSALAGIAAAPSSIRSCFASQRPLFARSLLFQTRPLPSTFALQHATKPLACASIFRVEGPSPAPPASRALPRAAPISPRSPLSPCKRSANLHPPPPRWLLGRSSVASPATPSDNSAGCRAVPAIGLRAQPPAVLPSAPPAARSPPSAHRRLASAFTCSVARRRCLQILLLSRRALRRLPLPPSFSQRSTVSPRRHVQRLHAASVPLHCGNRFSSRAIDASLSVSPSRARASSITQVALRLHLLQRARSAETSAPRPCARQPPRRARANSSAFVARAPRAARRFASSKIRFRCRPLVDPTLLPAAPAQAAGCAAAAWAAAQPAFRAASRSFASASLSGRERSRPALICRPSAMHPLQRPPLLPQPHPECARPPFPIPCSSVRPQSGSRCASRHPRQARPNPCSGKPTGSSARHLPRGARYQRGPACGTSGKARASVPSTAAPHLPVRSSSSTAPLPCSAPPRPSPASPSS